MAANPRMNPSPAAPESAPGSFGSGALSAVRPVVAPPGGADLELKGTVKAPCSVSRSTLETLVQVCVVELFQSARLTVAPLGVSRRGTDTTDPTALLGVVVFSGEGLSGRITLSLHDTVYSLLDRPPVSDEAKRDTVKELANQLCGRIKNRLLRFRVALRTSLPAVMNAQALVRPRGASVTTYTFGTRRGDVVAAVEGNLNVATLDYQSSVIVQAEGEVVLFDS
jgi:hypothetical protein